MKILFYFFCLIPFFLALPLDVIDIDTAQYAEIAREMVVSGNYLQLVDNGMKYLDKPILTFWNIALFYKLFGIGEIQFRATAILVLILTSLSLMHLTYLLYDDKKRAYYAGIIYLTIPGIFTIVLNPLIDIYLCFYLTLVHHVYFLGVKRNKHWYYLMYFIMGMAVITKGPIGIVIPGITIGGDILFRRDFKRLSEMKIIPGFFILAVLPGIWSYLLYTEYDVYGPYFFLWQQSFGRFYDKIYNQKLQPSYFYINYLWGIFPFAFFLLKEIYINVLKFIKNRPIKENLTTIWNGSRDKNFVIGFWVFLYLFLISFSKFQLPQYTYWALPGGAIFLSGLLLRFPENTIKSKLILSIPSIILLSSIIIIPALIIDVSYGYWILSSLLLIVGYLFYIRIKDEILLLILPVIVVFSLISFYVFPELVKFQPSKEVSKVIKQFEPDKEYIYTFGVPFSKRSYEFYSERYMRNLFRREQLRNDLKSSEQFTLVLVALEFYPFLSDRFGDEFKYEILKEYPSYKIATPKKKFLMKKTRDKELSKVFLIKIQRK